MTAGKAAADNIVTTRLADNLKSPILKADPEHGAKRTATGEFALDWVALGIKDGVPLVIMRDIVKSYFVRFNESFSKTGE